MQEYQSREYKIMQFNRWKVAKGACKGEDPAKVMCPAVANPQFMGFKQFYITLLDKVIFVADHFRTHYYAIHYRQIVEILRSAHFRS